MSKYKKTENQLGDSNNSVVKSGLDEQDELKSLEIHKEQPFENKEFTDLEESRMEHPPEKRQENGSDKEDTDQVSDSNQSQGI